MVRLPPIFCLILALVLGACEAGDARQKDSASPAVAPPSSFAAAGPPIEVRACDSGAVVALEPLQGDRLRLIHKEKTWTLGRVPTGQGAQYSTEGVDWQVRLEGEEEVGQLVFTGSDGKPRVIEQCRRPAPVLAAAPKERAMPPCITPDLAYGVEAGDAGMGHRLATIRVENRGAMPCQLDGPPRVSLLDGGGKPVEGIETPVETKGYFGQVRAGMPILLAPSGTAYFDMGWSVIPDETKGRTSCPTGNSLRISPPGDNGGKALDLAISACGGKIALSPYRVVADRQMATVPDGHGQ